MVAAVGGCSPEGAPSSGALQPVDERDRVVLENNVNALVRAAPHLGPTARTLRMERMVLALQLHPDKQAALEALLARQLDPSSPEFHQWLTPQDFGSRFGPSAAELAQVTGWLSSRGFSIDEVATSGTWVNFSGGVTQVESAFATTIEDVKIDGVVRHANTSNPSIPRALAGLVSGVVSLHNIPRHAMNSGIRHLEATALQPDYTGSTGSHYLAPGDFATIYNVKALYTAGIDGTGQTIAIVGRTHPAATNWSTFRSTMALTANAPQVVLNGTDPGDLGADEDGEADLDVEWSGAVAKGATVKFVVSQSTSSTDGVDLSAQYIVNNNLAPVMSTSFGQCESSMGSAENTFYNNLWSQAASQGITSFISTGDSGAAGCNGGSDTSGSGKAVSGLSSTPYNVAVGGTQFNEGTGSYWSSTNGTGDTSALSYIPEVVWNESANVSGGSGLWASTGGASTLYAKPSWQVAPGVPADGKRDVPDVSLSAAGHDGYLVYTQGALAAIGGTSASSPSFAGLMALIVQKTGARQGNANPRFYQLAQAQYGSGGTVVFHDTTSGNNSVPGVTGFTAGTGYDEATGLGSVDAYALANAWGGTTPTPDFTLGASPTAVSVQQGAAGTSTLTTAVSGGFSNAIALSASGLPTGVTATFSPTSLAAPGSGTATLTLTASASATTGTATVTVTATGGGVTHTATVSLTVTAASGGNTVFSDGFEGTGWSTAQVSGTAGAWTLAASGSYPTASPHGGSKLADFNSYTSASGSQTRLYRATGFAIPSTYASVALTFWVYHDTGYTSDNDRVQAQVSTNGSTWTSVGTAVSRYTGATGWAQATVDLSAYKGQTVQLGFLGISAYGNDVYLDDVAVTGSGTGTPTYSVSGTVTLSGAGLAGVTVSTSGASATTAASGAFSLAGLANGTYTVTPSLSGYTFSPTSASATVSGANVTGVNFTATAVSGPTTLFTDGFESTGWSTAQVSGTAGAWTLVASGAHPTASPHGGTKLADFNSYTSASGSQTRLYRATGFAIPATYTTVTLKFWEYHDTGYTSDNDRVQVQVSTNGSTWTSVGTAVSRYTGSTGWAQASIDLSAYKGQTVQLGLLGISVYGNDIYVDDVTVTAQ
jgi:pseudomonalisin